MKRVGVAQLKAKLSEYLRAVRAGETFAVLDRSTPIARLAPIPDRSKPRIRKPAPGAPAPGRVPLPEKPLKLDLDIVDLLLDERQGSR
jgi:prevent-host-death family protein